jgi:hypothetical protein
MGYGHVNNAQLCILSAQLERGEAPPKVQKEVIGAFRKVNAFRAEDVSLMREVISFVLDNDTDSVNSNDN